MTENRVAVVLALHLGNLMMINAAAAVLAHRSRNLMIEIQVEKNEEKVEKNEEKDLAVAVVSKVKNHSRNLAAVVNLAQVAVEHEAKVGDNRLFQSKLALFKT